MDTPPRAGLGSFEKIHEIYYGTDDGFALLTPLEEASHDAAHIAGLYEIFGRFERFYRGVAPERRERVHYASVVGGLYGLNLIPIFRPERITFFDVNPHQITFFEMVRRAWIVSTSREDFLARLAAADYEARTDDEREVRACIAARQRGTLAPERGRSARTLLSSWRYALDHFDLTRQLLAGVPVETRVEAINSPAFAAFLGKEENLWIYCSNIMFFVFFDLHFAHPSNAAVFASYFEKTDILDLAGAGPGPVTVLCRLPMSVARRVE
jgi:hypothetical protein